MTEQPDAKPQPAPATEREMAYALCKTSDGIKCYCQRERDAPCGEVSLVVSLVRSWLAAERARTLEIAAQICDELSEIADTPSGANIIKACAKHLRANASQQKDAAA